MRRALLLGLITVALVACGSSESPAPASKTAPALSPEVAAAPGRLYLTDGRVLPAERWWESGDILFYRWQGETQMVPRQTVARIEGAPRPETTVTGAVETRSTLGSLPPATEGGTGPTPPSAEELTRRRLSDCIRPHVGDDASYIDKYLACVSRHGLNATRSEAKGVIRWELRGRDGGVIETYEVTGAKVSLASG